MNYYSLTIKTYSTITNRLDYERVLEFSTLDKVLTFIGTYRKNVFRENITIDFVIVELRG